MSIREDGYIEDDFIAACNAEATIDLALRNAVAHIELNTLQIEMLKMILRNTYLKGLYDGLAYATESSHAQADHGKYESCLDSRYPNGNPCADIRGEEREAGDFADDLDGLLERPHHEE